MSTQTTFFTVDPLLKVALIGTGEREKKEIPSKIKQHFLIIITINIICKDLSQNVHPFSFLSSKKNESGVLGHKFFKSNPNKYS